uniref:Uncharacterized protein n=2 Tax=Candidatus Kentrum sp. TC TaxID=2126339 RepID=A0A451A859_9GAMM|nr:MAG: conserved hypothetical protein (putative transposase or invertase) [Candidatus Kentron sp. TC]
MTLSEEERRAYEWYVEEIRYQASMDHSRFMDGRLEGRAEGKAEGLAEGKAEGLAEGKVQIARMMMKNGESVEKIAAYTELTPERIKDL